MAAYSYALAHPVDASSVRVLLMQCELPAEDIDQHIEHFVLAKDGHELVGTIGMELLGPTSLLRSFAVARQHRGFGVGRALYDRLVAYAHLRGVEEWYLLTETAHPYFSRLGFRAVSRSGVPASLQETREFGTLCPSTAVCMTKRIIDEARYFSGDTLQLRPDIPGAKM